VKKRGGGVESVLSELCDVLLVGSEDKVEVCMFKAMDIIEALEMCLRSKSTAKWLTAPSPRADPEQQPEQQQEETLVPQLTKDVMCPLMEATVRSLVGRLGDNHSGMSDAALEALEKIGSWPCCGAAFVAQIALKRLYKWEELMWRPVTNRLKLLEKLLKFAVQEGASGAGVLAAASLKFAKDCGAFDDDKKSHESIVLAAKSLEKVALEIMGEDAPVMIGDMRATSLLAEMQKAERARYTKLDKLVQRATTQGMDLDYLSTNVVGQTIEDVNNATEQTLSEVDDLFDRLIAKMQKRRSDMKAMVNQISEGKINALTHQKEDIESIKKGLDETTAMAKDAMQMHHKEEYSHWSDDEDSDSEEEMDDINGNPGIGLVYEEETVFGAEVEERMLLCSQD
jgi:hypothetical protein